jgi:hypothetical protein
MDFCSVMDSPETVIAQVNEQVIEQVIEKETCF